MLNLHSRSPRAGGPSQVLKHITVVALLAAAGWVHGAATDLSDRPVKPTGVGTAKPNIMLLMDTSKSMDFTHAPDTAEVTQSTATQTVNVALQPVGYRSVQCNSLYYNPATVYALPLNDAGVALPEPDFAAARYNYYSTDTTVVNLGTSFRAFDQNSRSINDPDYVDDPLAPTSGQAAYYYVFKDLTNAQPTLMDSGNPQLTPATKGACNYAFVNSMANVGGSFAVDTGGANPVKGTWYHVLVGDSSDVTAAGTTTADKKRNFARWYTYYRSRMSAAKSGLSLAFFGPTSPLSPTQPSSANFRVGFITANPLIRSTPASKPATGALVDEQYYQGLADFDATQKQNWYNKLASQVAGGSSPMREGLARVGRHYAGKTDSINAGMTLPTSVGTEGCQQNFTIMTTDGYWNTQAETVGGVKLDGVTLVGQFDGILTPLPDTNTAGTVAGANANTPYTVWDGGSDGILTTKYASNNYSQTTCATGMYNKTERQQKRKTLKWTVTARRDTKDSWQLWRQEWQQTYKQYRNQAMTTAYVETKTQKTSTETPYTVNQTVTTTTRSYDAYTLASSQYVQRSTYFTGSGTTYAWTTTQYPKSGSYQTKMETTTQQFMNEQWTNVAVCTDPNPALCATGVPRTGYGTYNYVTKVATAVPINVLDGACVGGTESVAPFRTTTCVNKTVPTVYLQAVTAGVNPCPAASWVDPNGYTTYTCSPSVSAVQTTACSVTGAPKVPATGYPYTQTKNSIATTSPYAVTQCTLTQQDPGIHADPASCGVTVTCSPAQSDVPVASCTVGAVLQAPSITNQFTTITCIQPTDTTPLTNYAPKAITAAQCVNQTGTALNNWVTLTCVHTQQNPAVPARCVPVASDAAYAANPNLADNASGAWGSASGWTYSAGAASTVAPGVTTQTNTATVTDPTTKGVYVCSQTVLKTSLSPGSSVCNANSPIVANTGYTPKSTVVATAGNGFTNTACSGLIAGIPAAPTTAGACVAINTPVHSAWITRTCGTPTAVAGWPKFVVNCASTPASDATYTYTCGQIISSWIVADTCTPTSSGVQGSYTGAASASGTPTTSTTTLQPSDPLVTVACRIDPTYLTAGLPTTKYVAANDTTTCPTLTPDNSGPAGGWAVNASHIWTQCQPATMSMNTAVSPSDAVCGTPGTAASGKPSSKSLGATTNNGGTTRVAVTSAPYSASAPGLRICTWVNTAAAWGAGGYVGTAVRPPIPSTVPAAEIMGTVLANGNSSCVTQAPALANSWLDQTCTSSYPAVGGTVYNSRAQADASKCAAGGWDTAAPGFSAQANYDVTNKVYWSCAKTETNAFEAWGTVCTSAAPVSGNGFLATTCPGPAGNPGPLDDATLRIENGPTLVASCTTNAGQTGPNFMKVECPTVDGVKVQFTTTTQTTTQATSNGVPVGPITTTAGPSTTGAADVITGACYGPTDAQAIEMTTIFASGPVTGLAPANTVWWQVATPVPVAPCTSWPCTSIAAATGATGSANSLADVAQYYYVTDLRSESDIVPQAALGLENDRAKWQHMTTFVLGMGVSGTIPYSPTYKSDPLPASASTLAFPRLREPNPPMAMSWPVWPTGSETADYQFSDPRSIDDFWHSAVNGRGKYFSAKDPAQLVSGIQDALGAIGSSNGAGSSAASSSGYISAATTGLYAASYKVGLWTGDVEAKPYTLGTGFGAATWTADANLASLLPATTPGCDDRNIKLMRDGATSGSSLVNFTWNTTSCTLGALSDGLSNAEKDWFGRTTPVAAQLTQFDISLVGNDSSAAQRTAAEGANLVNYLRGQSAYAGYAAGQVNRLYRTRDGRLGDIVNSQVVAVAAPTAGYADAGYAAFKTANVSRTPMVYVGANDGMLHAFNDSSVSGSRGKESWAVIPSAVAPDMYRLADIGYSSKHRFFVDGSPVVGDVYDTGTATWKTILVGGLNHGGKAFYALDITDPASPAALWEFKSDSSCVVNAAAAVGQRTDCNLGYSFGKPVITKLSDGSWVVLVTSGYNNHETGDGRGYLYVLNAVTGKIIRRMLAPAGDTTTPSGLREITNYVSNPSADNTTLRAYSADLLGNIWRFDINDTARDEAVLVTTLTDNATPPVPQPVTTRLTLAEIDGVTYIYVGTGRNLADSDKSNTQTQSVYSIRDPMQTPASGTAELDPATLRSDLRHVVLTTTEWELDAQGAHKAPKVRNGSCDATTGNCSSDKGWYMDFDFSGERLATDMGLALGTLAFASDIPNSNQCLPGVDVMNYVDYRTGLTPSGATTMSSYMRDSQVSGVIFAFPPSNVDNCPFKAIVTHSDGTVTEVCVPTGIPAPLGKRISWREIATQ